MSYRNQVAKYILADMLSAIVVWISFFLFRKIVFENLPVNEVFLQSSHSEKLFVGIIIVPVFWILTYYITG